jgi:hypothetical protein
MRKATITGIAILTVATMMTSTPGCLPTTVTGTVYFFVYNYWQKNVTATASWLNNSSQTVVAPILYNATGLSLIPPASHATLAVALSELPTSSGANVTLTFTFPDDANAQVTKTVSVSDLKAYYRVRCGVFDPNEVEIFVEPNTAW